MKEYGLEALLELCRNKGFKETELQRVTRAYDKTLSRYEERFPEPKVPGIVGAIAYMEQKFRTAYTAGVLEERRIIDEWHGSQADGRQ